MFFHFHRNLIKAIVLIANLSIQSSLFIYHFLPCGQAAAKFLSIFLIRRLLTRSFRGDHIRRLLTRTFKGEKRCRGGWWCFYSCPISVSSRGFCVRWIFFSCFASFVEPCCFLGGNVCCFLAGRSATAVSRGFFEILNRVHEHTHSHATQVTWCEEEQTNSL